MIPMTMAAENVSAKGIASGKCYSCGLGVSVAEADTVFDPKAGRQMILHELPECKAFINDDPDVYAQRCKLKPIDPIAEEFAKLLSDES